MTDLRRVAHLIFPRYNGPGELAWKNVGKRQVKSLNDVQIRKLLVAAEPYVMEDLGIEFPEEITKKEASVFKWKMSGKQPFRQKTGNKRLSRFHQTLYCLTKNENRWRGFLEIQR